ncbi:MAG: D-alanine-D-alanine ligase [Candidatus Azotimanducaceae bacterium]|jgi:D-alanine-D-alanine ligase
MGGPVCLSSRLQRDKGEHIINNQLKIAVISGGESAEADVSRVSAAGVMAALLANYPDTKNFELDSTLTASLSDFNPDVVFPVLHGPPGEDGTLQGYLEILGFKYVGSDVHSSSVAMNKIIAKHVFAAEGLPLAKQVVVERHQTLAQCIAAIEPLGHSVVVKPATQGSALGVTRVENENELASALTLAFEYDPKLLVEERIFGKEITVGVIETAEGIKPLPVIEIVTGEDSWYDFEHRYTAGLSDHVVPAVLTDAQTIRLQDIAIRAHVALGCRDLSRADFVVPDDDSEVLLEVNTLPGMTPTSLYPDAANVMGYSFELLVSMLVERAANRD